MNFKNSNKLKMLTLAISSLMTAAISNSANAANYEQEMVIVHPFQWTYDNIARECTEYLGPAGFDGVQISSPAEHVNRRDVWWAIYQPINFKSFTTMSGNEKQLKNMIKACNNAGVKVFVDAVLNQRGSGSGTGIGGSYYSDSNYPDGFTYEDFHTGCAINTYTDANQVRYCALSGMPDTATDRDSTQNKIADYLASLMNMGVYGFRIDAAKHMGYGDIDRILSKTSDRTGRRPPAYLEVIGAYGEAADIQPDKYAYINNAAVTDFGYVNQIKDAFNGQYWKAFDLGTYFDHNNAEVFVNNHDNEWGRCSAGTCSMLTQNNANYNLAQSWLAVWPVGKVRQIYSGYSFPIKYYEPTRVSDATHDQGGPLDANRCEGGWLCQHRVPFVLNSPRFARATRGQKVTSKGYDDGILWFNRGAKGFYAMNTTDRSVTHTFKVEVPDNTYCDILGTSDPLKKPCGEDVMVSGSMVTITIPAKSAKAICTDDEWCGHHEDICVTNPTSAECLCKDEGKNSAGVCQNYCSTNPGDDRCFCIQNPDDDSCQTPATRQNLCYAGTSSSWNFVPMTYSGKTGTWTVDLTLDGSANQRFKVAEKCSWNGTVYGSSGIEGKLAVNNSTSGDVYTSLSGSYVLSVKDSDMTYTLTKKSVENRAPVAAFSYSTDGLSVNMSNASTDADNDAMTYEWKFGNGQTSTAKNPVVTYSKAGTYTVALTTTDAKGKKSATVSKSVTVKNPENSYTQTKGNLCYAGTSNEWTFSKMSFNKSTGYWTINVTLDGSSSQRFKIVDGCSWNTGKIYGSSGTNGKLKINTSTSGDEYTSLRGSYVLMVKDSDMTYSFTKAN